MQQLMIAIKDMLSLYLVVTDTELHNEFALTEALKEVTDIKAAAILLQDQGACRIVTTEQGGYALVRTEEDVWH